MNQEVIALEANLILDNKFIPEVWALIMKTKSTLDFSFYKAELPPLKQREKINLIYQAIFLKKKEGVTIRFLLNREQPLRGVSRYNVAVATFLKEKNIPCRFLNDSRCCHAKFIISDRNSFYIGSHNLSRNAVSKNFEAGVIINDTNLGLDINDRFNSLWDSGKDFI